MRRVWAALWLGMLAAATSAEPLPARLEGTWRIVRILPTGNTACWDSRQAGQLIGSTLTYRPNLMRWKGGDVPVSEVVTRTVTAHDFETDNGREGIATFAEVGIHLPSVTEVDLQHEDMDITGATTEVPGDSVLMAAPNRIVVSACGVYFEAVRKA